MEFPVEIPVINWTLLIPFLIVIGTASLVLAYEMLAKPKSNTPLQALSLFGLLGGIVTCGMLWSNRQFGATFTNSYLSDPLSLLLNIIILSITALTVLFAESYLKDKEINYGEFYPMLIFATSGAMLMVSSFDLIVIFLGLEILSISLYVLAGLSRRDTLSQEAAIKYFLLGAFATGFLLYGIALIYGATGTTQLDIVLATLQRASGGQTQLMLGGLALLLVGLGFKSALVPFHMWTPDVYQGAPTAITAYMAAAVKVAAFGVILRVIYSMNLLIEFWQPALFVLALLTMTVGNIIAVRQRDAKRMLAYSSISHAGYLLVGIIANNQAGFSAVLYYLIAYSAMTLGAFAVLAMLTSKLQDVTDFNQMAGLYTRRPAAAVLMTVFMASLAGIPPTAGFFGKLSLFQASMLASQGDSGPIGSAGHIVLAIAIAFNSAISLFYYFGIVQQMYVKEPTEALPELNKPSGAVTFTVATCAVAVFYFAFMFSQINSLTRYASVGSFPTQPPVNTAQR